MRADPVLPEVREAVIKRDGVCFLKRLDAAHQCRRMGRPHLASDRGKLTVDHFHHGYGTMGDRAPSDPQHMVAMCYDGNNGSLPRQDPFWTGPSARVRAAEREYVAGLEAGTPSW